MSAKPLDEKAIFRVACSIDSVEARDEYLSHACGDNRVLLDRVAVLLRMREEEPDFLERPSANVAATVDLPPVAERPGTTIGRYKLLEEIAEGGMGVVYMAEQREPVRRKLALKIIKPGMDTREVIARFEAERQALAMMDHLNIAKVFDAGETASGRSYFVMELVRGISLTDYCDQNELTTRERLELFVQVCHAVQHAHQKGIIHRDLKPSNVMVTLYDGVPVPKIIDFGIAKATTGQLTARSVFTHYGQMIGTPLYMSPEQAEMSGLDVDTRSDIYSLGMMLYELLTGSTPFDPERVQKAGYDEIRRMIREDEPPRPSARISTLGAAATTISTHRKTDPAKLCQLLQRDLDWIVMKALQKDRTRRYQTASDFARDIERYLHDEPVEARPPTLANRLAKWARRHRPLVGSAAVFLVLSTIGLAISTLLIAGAYREKNQQLTATEKAEQLAREQEGLAKQQEEAAKQQAELARKQQQLARRQSQIAEEQKRVAVAQREEATQQRDAAQRNLYLAHMRLGVEDWRTGQVGRLNEMLDSHLPQSGQADLRGWEWYYFFSMSHQDLITLRGHRDWVESVTWSPDGKKLASASRDGTVRIWDATTGKEVLTLTAHNGAAVSVAWSPDGRHLASGGADDKTVKIWDSGTGKNIITLPGGDGWNRLAWSPDGRRPCDGGWRSDGENLERDHRRDYPQISGTYTADSHGRLESRWQTNRFL